MKLVMLILAVAACAAETRSDTTSQVAQGILACTGQEPGDGGACCPGSPIIVDMAGDGFSLTSPQDGVMFRLNPARWGQWAWTPAGSDDSFLALDLNDNGEIDSGIELFGDNTEQVAAVERNGFAALAVYDLPERGGNADGVIDSSDQIWTRLQLWRDVDHDGHAAPLELRTVAGSGIQSFSLAYVRTPHTDTFGNEFRFVSTIVAQAPIGRAVSDVWLQQAPITTQSPFIAVCAAWAYRVDANFPNNACQVPGEIRNDWPMTSGVRRVREVYRTGVSQSDNATQAATQAISLLANATLICGDSVGLKVGIDMYPPPYFYESLSLGIRVKCWHEDTNADPTPGGGGCFR
jgi:hypothetical protein